MGWPCSQSYTYSGRSVTVTDCKGRSKTKTMNCAGDVISATDPGGPIAYIYHSSGQPGQIAAAGSTTTMVYDEYGMQTSLADPDAGTTTYSYNALGQLVSQTNAKNQVSSLTYDKLGRILTKTTPEGTTTYTYDNATKGIGQVSSVAGVNSLVTYTYDPYSRVSTETTSYGGLNYTYSYTYDNDKNQVAQMTYPSDFAVTYEYDSYGYLKKVKRTDNGSKIWECGTVNQYGQVTTANLGNNLAVTNGYNQYGLPTTIQTGSVQNMEFSFDTQTGNLTWRKDKVTGRNFTETFTYDNLDRLTNCNIGSNNYGITYNNNGNINTKHDAGTYQYGTKPHAVTGLTESPITSAPQNIIYNSFDKPTRITEDSKSLNITYGADDERIHTAYTEDSTSWGRLYIGSYEEETTGSATRKLHYIGGGDGLAAVYIQNGTTGTMYYVSKDYLGNIMLLTNQNGAVAEEYSYDAWGRRRSPTNWSSYTVAKPAILYRGYTGHEHLDEFALINMNGRVYDPTTGRFLSPDPFVQAPGFTQSYNRYSYCLNNPLKYSDPSGMISFGLLPGGCFKNILSPTMMLGVFAGIIDAIYVGITGKDAIFGQNNNSLTSTDDYTYGYNFGYISAYINSYSATFISTGRFFYNGSVNDDWNYWDLAPLGLFGLGIALNEISWPDKSGRLGPYPDEPHAYNTITLKEYLGFAAGSGNLGDLLNIGAGPALRTLRGKNNVSPHSALPPGTDYRANLETSTNPVVDIFSATKYAFYDGNLTSLSDVVIPNNYSNLSIPDQRYRKVVSMQGYEIEVRVSGQNKVKKNKEYYNFFKVGFGYLDKFSNYPKTNLYNNGFYQGFYMIGYDKNILITIGVKNDDALLYLKLLFNEL